MDRSPNVIYILADDMGFGDISALNEKAAFRTPNFDALARQGIAFTDAHATSAVCTPSRYSLLTGRYNWRSRLKWGVISGFGKPVIERGRKTVADMLKTCGYQTAMVGKWHLGMEFGRLGDAPAPEGPASDPAEIDLGARSPSDIDYAAPIRQTPVFHGFDYYYGISGSLDMPPYVYIENSHFTRMPDHETSNEGKGFWRVGPTAPDFVHEEVLPHLTDKVLGLIEEYHAQQDPFFIYFPMPAPHTPILPTEAFRGASGTNEYGDFVLECDAMVGRIADQLKKLGIFDNTVLIFTSDNGCSPRADYPELLSHGHNPSHVYRGHKYHIYEGGHRVPMIVTWPDLVPAGRQCDRTVCLSDLMATVAEIVGYDLPDDAGEDSVSNLPLWRDPGAPDVRSDLVHQSWDGSLAIRTGRYKLEMCCDSGGEEHPGPRGTYMFPPGVVATPEMFSNGTPDSRFQLYDLDSDVSETRNVIDDYPEVAAAMKATLVAHIRSGRSTPGANQPNTGAGIWDAVAWLSDEPISGAVKTGQSPHTSEDHHGTH